MPGVRSPGIGKLARKMSGLSLNFTGQCDRENSIWQRLLHIKEECVIVLGTTNTKVVIAVLRTLFLYGSTSWVYVVALQVTHPHSVFLGLAWWFPVRLDYFGEMGFIIMLASYFMLQLVKTQ